MSVKSPKNTTKKTKTQKRKEFDVDLMLPEKKKTIENTLENEQSINETLKKSFLKNLEMSFNVSQSLKRSGLSSRQYNLFLENDFEFNQAVQDMTNELIDFAQSKLYKFINIEPYYKDNDGNIHKHPLSKECLNATKFLLERLGASHGWNGEPIPDLFKEKQDNTIEIVIVEPDGTKKPKRKTLGAIDETN